MQKSRACVEKCKFARCETNELILENTTTKHKRHAYTNSAGNTPVGAMSRVARTREPIGNRAALAADRFGANDAAPLPNANEPKPVGAADAAVCAAGAGAVGMPNAGAEPNELPNAGALDAEEGGGGDDDTATAPKLKPAAAGAGAGAAAVVGG